MISEKEYQARMAAAAGKPHMKVIPVQRMTEKQKLQARINELCIKLEQLEFENTCLRQELHELGGVSFGNEEGAGEEWKQ